MLFSTILLISPLTRPVSGVISVTSLYKDVDVLSSERNYFNSNKKRFINLSNNSAYQIKGGLNWLEAKMKNTTFTLKGNLFNFIFYSS